MLVSAEFIDLDSNDFVLWMLHFFCQLSVCNYWPNFAVKVLLWLFLDYKVSCHVNFLFVTQDVVWHEWTMHLNKKFSCRTGHNGYIYSVQSTTGNYFLTNLFNVPSLKGLPGVSSVWIVHLSECPFVCQKVGPCRMHCIVWSVRPSILLEKNWISLCARECL